HAVPTPFAVVHGLVAHRLEGECREGSVGQLRLLQAHDIGLHVDQPLLDAGKARFERVDVPSCYAHPATVAASGRTIDGRTRRDHRPTLMPWKRSAGATTCALGATSASIATSCWTSSG